MIDVKGESDWRDQNLEYNCYKSQSDKEETVFSLGSLRVSMGGLCLFYGCQRSHSDL